MSSKSSENISPFEWRDGGPESNAQRVKFALTIVDCFRQISKKSRKVFNSFSQKTRAAFREF